MISLSAPSVPTRARVPLAYAPSPRLAANHSPLTGLNTTPHIGRPRRQYATDTANCGTPCAKLFVPSSGSITHRSSASPSARCPSSAKIACPGNAARTTPTTAASASMSASETKL